MNTIPPEALLLSLLLGVLCGLLFTALECVRFVFSLGRTAMFVFDVLFCLAASVLSFLLALAAAQGSLRFFQAACEIIGFLLVYMTLTFALRRLENRILRKKRAFRDKRKKKRRFSANKAKKTKKRLE